MTTNHAAAHTIDAPDALDPDTSPSTAYRTAATPAPEDSPPNVFAYDATDAGGVGRGNGMQALFRYFSLPLLAATAVAALGGQLAGVAGLACAAGCSFWSWRNRKSRGGAVIRIDRGAICVETHGTRPLLDRFRFGDLADIVLDVRTIQRVMEGNSAIPAMRFVDSKVGPKIDTARIVLVGGSGREVALTEEYLSHMHATEWLGKIRTFLRKHGWVPENER